MKNLILIILLIISIKGVAQTKKSDGIRLRVLQLNHVGKTYKFNTEDSTVTYFRYLGKINTAKGRTYKILTSVWIWGRSHRATSCILVYTVNNFYVGNYYLTLASDLPGYIKNNKLVFTNKEPDCDNRLFTYLDFSNGIPKEFFRKCKGDGGDIYSFLKNNSYNQKNKPNIRSTYGR